MSPHRLRPSPPDAARRPGRRGLSVLAVLLFAAVAAAAETPIQPPPTIDPSVLDGAADVIVRRARLRAHKAKAPEPDPAVRARARRATETLVSYAGDIRPAAADWSWIVTVEERPEAIAYALPTGKILVSSALFDRVKLTEDEFTAIIAHVVAHELIGQDVIDAVAAYRRERGTATPDPDPNRAALQLADAMVKLVLSDHYDAAAEKAADAVGLELMARAGVDPGVAAGAWRKLAAAGGTGTEELIMLHPAGPDRLAAIEAQARAVAPLYQQALVSRSPPGPAPLMRRR